MYEELNKKLLEFAGYTDIIVYTGEMMSFTTSDGRIIIDHRLTESLDACFKWLVPKLASYKLYPDYNLGGHIAIVSLDRQNWEDGKADTSALALCLAIEKLIDGGS